MSTELTVIERAAMALGAAEHEKKLVALARRSVAITTITNAAGYRECHSARMALKSARTNLQKLGKAARDDATKFSKAVIAEEARLIALIEPEEKRLEAIQDAEDARREAEKEAAAKAEADRIAAIQKGIDGIKQFAVDAVGAKASEIAALIERCTAHDTDGWSAEFADIAQATKAVTLDTLEALHVKACAQEAEVARIAAERAELERQREEQAENARKEKERLAAEERASLERIEADERRARAQREEQDRIAAQARAAEEARLKIERDQVEAGRRELEARERAERERIEEQEAKLRAQERKAREEAEAAAKAEQDIEQEIEREERRRAMEFMDAREILKSFKDRFGFWVQFEGIVFAIDEYFGWSAEFADVAQATKAQTREV